MARAGTRAGRRGGVAGEALHDGQQRQDGTDHPVDLARLAEGTGGPEHVHREGDDEHQRGPVAILCAKFSVDFTGNIDVDFTQRRNVKIQSGANVLYNPYSTIGVKI